ncbi:MAG: trypsin-like serine peptidase [Planctomycetota bacterium]
MTVLVAGAPAGDATTVKSVDKKGRRTLVGDAPDRPDWARAVALLTVSTRGGRVARGTAVLVSTRYALTAHHCVKDFVGSAELRFGYDGARGTIAAHRSVKRIARSSATGDWALLELDRPLKKIRALELAEHDIFKYDTKRMMLAGYSCDTPIGRGGKVLTCDARCRMKKSRKAEGRLLTDGVCYEGASGGPAFVRDKQDEAWHFVGIVQGNINARDTKSFITYVVYQNAYKRAVREAIRAGMK